MPWRWAPAARSSGKVSRSTETGRPAGMVSMTERRKTYAPALIWSVTISSGVCGFSRNGGDPAGGVRGDQAERARVLDPGEVQGDVGAGRRGGCRPGPGCPGPVRMSPLKISTGSSGRGVQPRGHVADGAAGAERLLLGDVLEVEAQRRAVAEVRLEDLGEVGRGEHDVLDARRSCPCQLVREERYTGRRHHGLGRVHREGAQPRALAADQEDRFCHLSSLLPAGAGRTSAGQCMQTVSMALWGASGGRDVPWGAGRGWAPAAGLTGPADRPQRPW